MNDIFQMNAVNEVPKDTIIYKEDETINSISFILKGKVEMKNQGSKMLLGPGNFLGISDLYTGYYMSTYKAYENLSLFIFNIKDPHDIERILTMKKDYSGVMVAVLGKYIIELDKIYLELKERAAVLYRDFIKMYKKYEKISQTYLIPVSTLDITETLTEYKSNFADSNSKYEYYKECSRIPLDIQKSYFGSSTFLTLYQLEQQSYIVEQYIQECKELASYNLTLFYAFLNDSNNCLFKYIAKLAIQLEKAGIDNTKLSNILDEIIEQINKTELVFEENLGQKLSVNRDFMEKVYYTILSGTGQKKAEPISVKESEEELVEKAFQNSLSQILSFAEYKEEEAEQIKDYIKQFSHLKDKTAVDDNTRKLRRKISQLYYNLYKAVFLKAYKTKSTDKIIDLFLNYGFLDERMLTQEQLKDLYFLEPQKPKNTLCSVYTMREWLTAVYEGKKEPSKSEFDMDFEEFLREERKGQRISPEEEKDYLKDPLKRLEYEVNNMFQYNNRLVYGQISSFVPFLYEDVFLGKVQTSLLTADKINEAIQSLCSIDFSVFYRETVYSNLEIGIKKENIMVEIFPDIILMPIFGSNPVMWQEISGRKRTTPGRFLLPSFANINLQTSLVKILGMFRWELCRTIQGTSWNNITYKSLTSEYSDYIQFYRKNRELSDEKKIKLKLQIQKCRNNLKEIFAQDYETWILNESQGAIRLNKPVREIIATYCPFSKEIREKIKSQPLFEEAMMRYNREKMQKLKELNLKFRVLEKDKIDPPPELLLTKDFYTNL